MQNRFNNPVQIAKEYINNNKFGKIISITARVRWSRNQKYYDQASWRGTWKYDGGVLANQGIHHIDLMYYLGGKVSEAFAYSSRRLVKIQTEDTAVAVLKFKSGALGTLEVTTATRPRDLEGSISVLGSLGTIEIGGFAVNKMKTWSFINENEDDKEVLRKFSENPPNVYGFGHKLFYDHVVECIINNKKSFIDGREGQKTVRILEAIYKSAKNNVIVHI